jgi:hypothetical protein
MPKSNNNLKVEPKAGDAAATSATVTAMAPFPTAGDLTEWQECRATIGRLDGTIADLRKFGFSLVTVLITASSFQGERTRSVSIAIMTLIAALFAVDRYYTLLLNAAVERALDLEGPRIDRQDLSKDRITQVISVYVIGSGAVFLAPLLYVGFLWATLLLRSAEAKTASPEVDVWFWSCLSFVLIYFFYTERKSKTGFFGDRRR